VRSPLSLKKSTSSPFFQRNYIKDSQQSQSVPARYLHKFMYPSLCTRDVPKEFTLEINRHMKELKSSFWIFLGLLSYTPDKLGRPLLTCLSSPLIRAAILIVSGYHCCLKLSIRLRIKFQIEISFIFLVSIRYLNKFVLIRQSALPLQDIKPILTLD